MSDTVVPTTKLLNILYACAHGRLPWWPADDLGPWPTAIPLCDGIEYDDDESEVAEHSAYVLCCGHTLSLDTEAPAVIGAGLMLPGLPDKFGRRTLTITKAGRRYLDDHFKLVEIRAVN